MLCLASLEWSSERGIDGNVKETGVQDSAWRSRAFTKDSRLTRTVRIADKKRHWKEEGVLESEHLELSPIGPAKMAG